jgi:hypothetical protein
LITGKFWKIQLCPFFGFPERALKVQLWGMLYITYVTSGDASESNGTGAASLAAGVPDGPAASVPRTR